MSNPRPSRADLLLALLLLALSASTGQSAATSQGAAAAAPPPPTARIEWREVEGARAYELEIRNAEGATVFRGRSEKAFIDLALPPGGYSMRIIALNVFLKAASESPWMELGIVQAVLPRVEALEPRLLPLGVAEALLLVRGEGIFRGTRLWLERPGLVLRGEAAAMPPPLAPPTLAPPTLAPPTLAPPTLAPPPGSETPPAGLVFRFELKKAFLGDYDLVLENPGGMRTVVPAAFGLRSPPEYWLGLELPPLPRVEAPLAEPEPPLALGWGPAERERRGGPARAGAPGLARFAQRPDRGLRLSLGWSQGLLLDPEFSFLYGPSYLGASLGLELPLAALFAPPAFLRGAALEARLGVQSHPALISAGAEGSMFFGNLGGGLALGTDFAYPLNVAARLGGELLLTSLDSANPFFPGSLFSMDPAVYAGAALRFEYGRQRWELGLEWSGTFYLDFFMSRLRAGLGWSWALQERNPFDSGERVSSLDPFS